MNFDLSEEQIMLQDSVRRLLQQQLPIDRLIQVFDSEEGFDRDNWNQLFELGIGSILVPEADGGLGMELLDAALVIEAAGNTGAPGPLIDQLIATAALARLGSQEQKERWLPALMAGEKIVSLAFSEKADCHAPGQWTVECDATISGCKNHVVGGHLADLFLVGLRGGRLGLVELAAGGVSVEALNSADRGRLASQLVLEDVEIDLLADDVAEVEHLFDAARVLLAADAYGGAERCNEMTLEYAKTREQFGTLIVNFQAVKHRLVDMTVDLELSKGLYWYAAHTQDRVPEEAAYFASLAKAHITETFMQIARHAVELHGGIGFTWEYPLQVFFKRAMFDRNYLGQPATLLDRAADMSWPQSNQINA